VEYEMTSNQKQKDLSHAWIDAGADMVIGAHPHVRQESEIYKDKHIYYSLGNYIFDQWFSSEVKTGKVLDITFTKYKNLDGVVEKSIKLDQSLEVNISKELIKYR
jgi:poly-gamma-glutamate synthesis protein (capsule biosynthesis protein)